MAGIGNNMFAGAAATTPTAPPPPVEVKVRTMKSDLAAVAQTGGGMPSFKTVKLMDSRLSNAVTAAVPAQGSEKKSAIIFIITVAAIFAIGLIGYIIYTFLKK